jgi:hypothetical protein
MTDSFGGCDYSLAYIDLAVVRGPELLLCKQYALGVDLASRVAVIQRALDELISMPYAPSVIAMETPWVREGRGVRSALELHAIPHYVTALAAERGIETRFVAVPTWRSVVLGNGKLSTEAAKVLSVQYVSRVYRYASESHNAADAACLATWARDTARFKAKVGAR